MNARKDEILEILEIHTLYVLLYMARMELLGSPDVSL